MTDWTAAGRKADAHLVRDLYRQAFSESKAVARQRVIEAMRAAGVTTVLDLWGGGVSAKAFVEAGFRVVAVDDGTMELLHHERPVSRGRKRRALEYTASEDGYEARWGHAAAFASEADGAYLDFCGPWTANVRRTVAACRHMKAVAVTLTPDHDFSTDATSMQEREMAYQLYLKMAWSDRPRWEAVLARGHVRRLLDYRRARGYAVFLYLLGRGHLRLPYLKMSQRQRTRPDIHARNLARKRAWYHSHDAEWKRQYSLRTKHRYHLKGSRPRTPCPLCEAG